MLGEKKLNTHIPSRANPPKNLHFTKLSFYLVIGWTLLLVAVLAWNCVQVKKGIEAEAIIALRMSVENDHSFRAWATEHGGVYVPITPTNPPNPYLAEVEDYILPVPNKNALTLLNPAYIMRQIYEIRMDDYRVYNRLTSLEAINPINIADCWETESLEKLEENNQIKEIIDITNFNGEPAIRLMQPFIIEEGCLKCHGYQGYEIGDLRGGISASLPLTPYAALISSQQIALLPGYSLIWLVGLFGITWLMTRIKQSTLKLQKNEARNRAMVKAIPDVIFHYNAEGIILDAKLNDNLIISQIITDHEIIGQNVADIMPAKNAQKVSQAIKRVLMTGKMQLIEHSYANEAGLFHFEERLVLEGEKNVMSIVRDVTQQKDFETKLEYLSYHDELTGVYNRNYFEYELTQLNKYGKYPITIILSDINGLKLINDALGHSAGDKLLINCAQVLKQSLRSSDILARVGGDEFAAILPLTNEKKGREIILRIQSNIVKHNQELPSLPLSLSLGFATAQDNKQKLIDIYKIADDQMYQEKLAKGTSAQCKMVETLLFAAKNESYSDLDYNRLKEICKKMGIDIDPL